MPAGRPPKDNELKKALGSKHYKPDVPAPSGAAKLLTPDVPPVFLSEESQRQWIQFIPSLAKHDRVFEHHRISLCVLCRELAVYFSDNLDDPRERRLSAETIIDIQRELGLTVLSGLKLGSNVASAAPVEPVNARKR